ncbi:MAG: FAD-binding protein [Clostridiales bacterium]|nr:FAD-binding protein [Clostridiales bacterium]
MKKRMKRVLAGLLSLSLVAGMSCVAMADEEAVTYTETAAGRNGDITVSVTFSGSEITDVVIDESSETVGVADAALELIPQWVVEYQSVSVDTVSGATLTSSAIKRVVSAAITEAGFSTSDYSATMEHEAETLDDMTADVVVVGGGTAGMAAAIGAANMGASVIVLEKNYMTGGSGALSSARMNIIESTYVQENVEDADDSWEVLENYLIGKYEEGSDTYEVDWDYLYYNLTTLDDTILLLTDLGVNFEAKASSHGAEVIGESGGASYMAALTSVAEEQGITILTNTTGDAIIMEDGAAVGVEATSNGDSLTIHASKVILTTGGSLYDTEAEFENYPSDSNAIISKSASTGDTGDGQRMAEAVGASIEDGLRIKQSGVEFNQTLRSALPSENRPSTSASIIVNEDGERFLDESTSSMAMADLLWAEGSSKQWLIADTALENVADALASAYEAGLAIYYGETIEELAEAIGADPDTLQATVERYNELCAAGEDEDFGKAAENLVAYEGTSGYYAYQIYGGAYGTMGGGITIDYTGHVLDTDGNVIENLFAAGECADGNIFGDYYVGGMSMGTFTTAGRVAGETAALELTE